MAAAILFALAGTVASTLFQAGVPPVQLAEVRAAVAFAGLSLVPAARVRPLRSPPWPRTVLLGASLALVTLAYYVAVDHLAVAVAIVLQYTGPALVVGWTALRVRRRPPPVILSSLVAALLGVTLVSGLASTDLDGADLTGVGAGLGSAVFFAAYTLLSEEVGDAYGPVGAMLRGFGIATGIWTVYALVAGWPGEALRTEHLAAVGFVSLGGTLAAFLLYVWGVERVRAERASIAATLEPVVAAAVAWAWLGERLSPQQLIGGALVIGAVVILQLHQSSPPAAIPAPGS